MWSFYRSTSCTYEEDLQPLLRAVRELLSPGYGSTAAFMDHGCVDCPLIIFGTSAAVGKLADQGPAVPVRPVNKSLRLLDLRAPNCQGVMHLTGRFVGNFDPEGLIFAVRLYSEPVELYDLRAFDKVPFNTFKLPRDKLLSETQGNSQEEDVHWERAADVEDESTDASTSAGFDSTMASRRSSGSSSEATDEAQPRGPKRKRQSPTTAAFQVMIDRQAQLLASYEAARNREFELREQELAVQREALKIQQDAVKAQREMTKSQQELAGAMMAFLNKASK
ncbi:hypothetical protein HPB47_007004 [Ixodes persulcatus]|uniref:Uncharacterized protein n=1 Tax=Ixodes persulcatus TaxID=34615 RepID=A0AC60P9N1_IXOPE|nr:hypothetical protein HPB47_007004 [Ixodes persulcatus]